MLTFGDLRGVGVSRMIKSAFFSKLRPLTKLQGLTLFEATFFALSKECINKGEYVNCL